MFSMRSAAALSAATTAVCVAWVRSAEATLAFRRRRQLRLQTLQLLLRLRQLVGERERRHDGEPGVADLAETRAQLCDARVQILPPDAGDRASSPSSQAMRNWRPLMVTLTCDMAFPA